MDKLVRKIEVPLARNIVNKAGLDLVPKERLGELADVAMDAYQDYPLHNWFSGSKTLPFLRNGGIGLILHSGPGIIGRLFGRAGSRYC